MTVLCLFKQKVLPDDKEEVMPEQQLPMRHTKRSLGIEIDYVDDLGELPMTEAPTEDTKKEYTHRAIPAIKAEDNVDDLRELPVIKAPTEETKKEHPRRASFFGV